MIISTVDRYLFETLAITLLTKDSDEENLVSNISKIKECLKKAKPLAHEDDYVSVKQTTELDKNIDVLFKKTFVGYDTAWESMNARLKFSGIISAIWHNCHNSLWKLRIAARNYNKGPSDQIVLENLAPGVQEFEDGALTSLDQSIIMALRNMKTVEPMDFDDNDTEQVVNLKQQIAERDAALQDLKNRYDALYSECADIQMKSDNLEAYVRQINGELTLKRQENESLQREISSRKVQFDSLMQTKKTDDAQKSELQQQYADLQQELSDRTQFLEKVAKSNTKFDSLYTTAQGEIAQLSHRIAEMENQQAPAQDRNEMLALEQYEQQSEAGETEFHSPAIEQRNEYEVPPRKPKGRSRTHVKVLNVETREYDPNAPTTFRPDN